MRFLVAVAALLLVPVALVHAYDAQLKFDIDAACIGVDPDDANSECRSLCQPGECCFVFKQDCGSSIDCEVYERCDPVFDDPMVGEAGYGLMDPDTYDGDDIEVACMDMDPPPPPGHPSLCKLMCEPGKCCFEECSEEDLEMHDSLEHCHKYESCWVLYEGVGTQDDDVVVEKDEREEEEESTRRMLKNTEQGMMDPSTYDAKDIEEACKEVDGLLCHEMCEPGRCCFENTDCDLATHDKMEHCLKYTACWVLHPEGTVDDDFVPENRQLVWDDDTVDDDDDDTDGMVYAMMDPSTYDAKDIEVACEEMEPQAGSLCHLMCEAGRCCFENNDCDLATHDKMEHCLKYSACWILYKDGGTEDDDFVPEEQEMPGAPQDGDRHRGLLGHFF